MIFSHREIKGGKPQKVTEGMQVWSGWLSSQQNKGVLNQFS